MLKDNWESIISSRQVLSIKDGVKFERRCRKAKQHTQRIMTDRGMASPDDDDFMVSAWTILDEEKLKKSDDEKEYARYLKVIKHTTKAMKLLGLSNAVPPIQDFLNRRLDVIDSINGCWVLGFDNGFALRVSVFDVHHYKVTMSE